MERLTLTPFGRQPVSAGQIASRMLTEEALTPPAPAPEPRPKWALFRDLCTARAGFGVSDRDLTVLNALLSFYPADDLGASEAMVVFPSNAALSERAHGMAESTLRRHLAALVTAGLLVRHDSPNGKRYARRDRSGRIDRAFGFDLAPLLARADEIAAAARATREAQEERRRLRETVVLALRDASSLIAHAQEEGLPGLWDALEDRARLARRALRRKLDGGALRDLAGTVKTLGTDVTEAYAASIETKEMSGRVVENERHQQNSNEDSSDLEPPAELRRGAGEPSPKPGAAPRLPLELVLKAAPSIIDYGPDQRIGTWDDLFRAASFAYGMMGISAHAWETACADMGPLDAAITLACILERTDSIQSPGGYLRALTTKAGQGAFSPGPMVMALLSTGSKKAA
ncbi:plasmid replication protein RepC [Litorisediminicola beolgyonensis]|uniref:Plasmid replication protein RepC n=1 Tax=Litorisediminicola beolgyonensis TaxID=1173614 RepID=A0ABW3ZMW2_9RHOB